MNPGIPENGLTLAEQQNISVVPTLIMGTKRLVGARPYGAMEALVARHMA